MTPTSDRKMDWLLNQASAIFNQCSFNDINGIGPWGAGRTLIVNPEDRILQKVGERETILTEIINLDEVTIAGEYDSSGLC